MERFFKANSEKSFSRNAMKFLWISICDPFKQHGEKKDSLISLVRTLWIKVVNKKLIIKMLI